MGATAHTANDTVALKFFLAISKSRAPAARFKERLDDPARQWKISASDYSERDLWDDYTGALPRTCTQPLFNQRVALA